MPPPEQHTPSPSIAGVGTATPSAARWGSRRRENTANRVNIAAIHTVAKANTFTHTSPGSTNAANPPSSTDREPPDVRMWTEVSTITLATRSHNAASGANHFTGA